MPIPRYMSKISAPTKKKSFEYLVIKLSLGLNLLVFQNRKI